MKKITIKNVLEVLDTGENLDKRYANFEITGPEEMSVSDGYHTFEELYEHRIVLYIALCRVLKEWGHNGIWRSTLHSDGSSYEGWFILGIAGAYDKGKQITYHLPIAKWEDTYFAETLEKAPEWDGHTSQDVLERIKNL